MNFQLALGKTSFAITGSTLGRNASLNVSSPVINTANLPMTLPLQKPVEIRNLKIAAEVKGQEAQLQNLSFQLFDGQVTTQGTVTSGPENPPFTGKATDSRLTTRTGARGPGHDSHYGQRNHRSRPRSAEAKGLHDRI